MQATYSFPEIKSLIRTLDVSSVHLLEEIVIEERECFSIAEIRALQRFQQLKHKQNTRNQVKLDYLLSYN